MAKSNSEKIPKKNWYVTMTDKFMSGWGHARGKTNKFVIGCNTYKQCQRIMRNAKLRDEMIYINYTSKKPYYNDRQFLVSYKDYKQLGKIWKR